MNFVDVRKPTSIAMTVGNDGSPVNITQNPQGCLQGSGCRNVDVCHFYCHRQSIVWSPVIPRASVQLVSDAQLCKECPTRARVALGRWASILCLADDSHLKTLPLQYLCDDGASGILMDKGTACPRLSDYELCQRVVQTS